MSIIDALLLTHFYKDLVEIIQEYSNFTISIKYLYDQYNIASSIPKQIINSYITMQQIDISSQIHIIPDNAEYLHHVNQFKYNGKLTEKILVFFTVDTPFDYDCQLSVRPTHFLAVGRKKIYKVSMNYDGIKYYRWLISSIYNNFGKVVYYDW